MPGRHGSKEPRIQEQASRGAWISANQREGVSIVICSAVLWPRQPAGKFGNLVSPSLAALHDFGSLGSPPGTVVFLAEPHWIPAVSQHMRGTNSTSLRALSLEPTSLADSSREEGVSGSPKG